MKVLIVGKDSYIGNHLQEWIAQQEGTTAKVVQLDTHTDEWKSFDYSRFDAIVQVAGIVHRPNVRDWNLYRRVNVDLPVSIAKLAQMQGVKQFIFLSTMAVYGVGKCLRANLITKDTPTIPKNMYGRSKLMAEEALMKLQNSHFNITIVRPPNVYGKGCKGRYIPGFVEIVKRLPIIPAAYENVKQSMMYIDNLSSFVYQAIKHNVNGVFMPQDDKSVSAIELTNTIAKSLGKTPCNSKLLGVCVRIFSFIPLIQKAYGGVEYDDTISKNQYFEYIVVPLKEGIKRTIEK